MLTPRTCPYCNKPYLPRQIKQIYCRPGHKEMACRRRRAASGDIRVVKFCPFYLVWDHRCTREIGHRGDHVILVANAADSVLESKTRTSTDG